MGYSHVQSICQKLSQYGIILQSYHTNKKGAIFYASQCVYVVQIKDKDINFKLKTKKL